MDLTTSKEVRLAMQLAGIKPKKGLGQHFLIDQASLEAIIAAASVRPSDTVLEIGPGLGVMTTLLVERAKRVVAVEADGTLAELLTRRHPANLEVMAESILDFDLRQMGLEYKVVANLPYYLTSKIFQLLFEAETPPSQMAVLVQREVAERITAGPGDMSVLALTVQYYAQARLVAVLGRHKFWPAPKVDSAILQVVRRPQPVFAAEPGKLFRLIKAGFGERRKMLRNSLAGGLNASPELVSQLLAQAGIASTARAQELELADWQRLYEEAMHQGLLA